MPVQLPVDDRDDLLIRSVASFGILYPLVVRATPRGRFHLVDGYRRYLAAKVVGVPNVLCYVGQPLESDYDDGFQILIASTTRSITQATAATLQRNAVVLIRFGSMPSSRYRPPSRGCSVAFGHFHQRRNVWLSLDSSSE